MHIIYECPALLIDNTSPGHGVLSAVSSTGVLESRKHVDDTALVSSTVNADDSHLPHSNQQRDWFKWEWASLIPGDLGSVPGSGRSAREGIGYPLRSSCSSLVAQLVKNLPAMRETWVWSLGWDNPLEKRKATHATFLAWRIPWTI